MVISSDTAQCRALTDPTFDYHPEWAWGDCPVCIDGNPDIAGIGVSLPLIWMYDQNHL